MLVRVPAVLVAPNVPVLLDVLEVLVLHFLGLEPRDGMSRLAGGNLHKFCTGRHGVFWKADSSREHLHHEQLCMLHFAVCLPWNGGNV